MRHITLILLLLPAFFGFNCQTCSEEHLDAREMANALADEFSGELEFENGVLEDGPPPDSDADGPQLNSLTAPLLAGAEEALPDGTQIGYDYEQWFDVLLHSPDSLAELDNVKGAIAFVQQANKDDTADSYIRVEQDMAFVDEGGLRTATFFARVHRLAELRQGLTAALRSEMQMREVPEGMVATDGNAYHVYMALFARLPDGTELVGNYIIWNLSTYPGDAGDNIIEMCAARSAFVNNTLLDTNVDILGTCPPSVTAAFGSRPADSSPCREWLAAAAGHNTIPDVIERIAPDPDYEEMNTVMYPAGTRFFHPVDPIMHVPPAAPDCQLELVWCPEDEPRCSTDTDCRTEDHICCNGLCRNGQISDGFCGECTIQCGGDDECLAGLCGQQQECFVDADCPLANDICCSGVCYDSMTDNDHCGDCTTQCTGGETCVDGICGSAPQCTPEIVLAAWDFEAGDRRASETAPNVIAGNFTCNDGNPYIDPDPLGGPGFWIAELGWNNAANYLGCFISPSAGYELRPVSVTFVQATESLAEGPTSFSIRTSVDGYVGDLPGTPLATSELPNLQSHEADLSQLLPGPDTRFRMHWFATGATNSQIKWGLDNVVIRGMVCQP